MTSAPELVPEIDKLEKRLKTLDKRLKTLEECLAGFMAAGAINGMYFTDEMEQWVCKTLKGKQLTPCQIWDKLFGKQKKLDKT